MASLLLSHPGFYAARHIVATLQTAGFSAFFAGGCVRDLLLGIEPEDFDVATSATPDEISRSFPRTQRVGAHFGVILVLDEIDGQVITTEVATFRHDGVYGDGRRPDAVRFSLDPREDVQRRDFTVNGMFLDPLAAEGVEGVLDWVGGRRDLEGGWVRAIGEADRRFEEDKLRMLRGVRFAARLGFSLTDETSAAMRRHAGEIVQVSPERIRDELTRMLTEGHAREAFETLHRCGLLAPILPEVERLRGVEQPPEYHPEGDVWAHTMLLLDHLPAGSSPTLAWGFLLHDIGKPATFQAPDPDRLGDRIRFNGHVEAGMRIGEEILRRMRFSNEDAAQIVALIRHHMQFGDVLQMKESTLRRFLRLPRFEEHLALHRADCLSAHGDLRLYDFARSAHERETPEEKRAPLLVTGRDLIAAGYRPGPAFKEMLLAAEDAQLERRVHSRDEGLGLVRERFGEPATGTPPPPPKVPKVFKTGHLGPDFCF